MLEIINIYKSFGEQKVLQGLSLTLEQGKIHTLVGGNGTGKTTLFNLITGFLRPDSGEIRYNTKRLDRLSPVSINSKGVTRTFQDLRIISQLTVKENILLSFKNNPGEKAFLESYQTNALFYWFRLYSSLLLNYKRFKSMQDDFSKGIQYFKSQYDLSEIDNNIKHLQTEIEKHDLESLKIFKDIIKSELTAIATDRVRLINQKILNNYAILRT